MKVFTLGVMLHSIFFFHLGVTELSFIYVVYFVSTKTFSSVLKYILLGIIFSIMLFINSRLPSGP